MVGLCCSLVGFLLIVYVAPRQAGDKLPTALEFIDRKIPPQLGNLFSMDSRLAWRCFSSWPVARRLG